MKNIKGTITFEAQVDNILGMLRLNVGNIKVILHEDSATMVELNGIVYCIAKDIQLATQFNPDDVIHGTKDSMLREICDSEGISGFEDDDLFDGVNVD